MWMSFGVAALPRWPVLILGVRSLGPVPDHPERPCKPCGTKKIVLPTTAAVQVRPGANAEESHPSDQITHSALGRETVKSRAIGSIMTHARDFPLESKHHLKQARACRDASRPPVNLSAAISVPCGRQPADPANTAGYKEVQRTPGATRRHCSQILTARRSPIAPRFMQEYSVWCWAPGPLRSECPRVSTSEQPARWPR